MDGSSRFRDRGFGIGVSGFGSDRGFALEVLEVGFTAVEHQQVMRGRAGEGRGVKDGERATEIGRARARGMGGERGRERWGGREQNRKGGGALHAAHGLQGGIGG